MFSTLPGGAPTRWWRPGLGGPHGDEGVIGVLPLRIVPAVRISWREYLFSQISSRARRSESLRTTARAATRLARWQTRELCAMPDGHNPHKPPLHPIEESIRHHDHLRYGSSGIPDGAAGVGKFLQSPEHRFGLFSKADRGRGIVLADVGQCGEKLQPSGRRELDRHGRPRPAAHPPRQARR